MNLENRMLMQGDNLEMMRSIDSSSVDLIATDPPFFGKAVDVNANPARSGRGVDAWDDVDWTMEVDEAEYEVKSMRDQRIQSVVDLAGRAKGRNFACFIAYMAVRVREMHRILKDDGIMTWHCDYVASAYLKLVFDIVFGYDNLLNELIWQRTSAKSASRRLARIHDTIYIYHKGPHWTWNRVFGANPRKNVGSYNQSDDIGQWKMHDLTAAGVSSGESSAPWRGFDPSTIGDGRHWYAPTRGAMSRFIIERGLIEGWPLKDKSAHERLDALDQAGLIHWAESGRPYLKRYLTDERAELSDIWTDIRRVTSYSNDNRRFRDQKPQELYKRLIEATTNEGDLVLDPFCGCSTTLNAAETINRQWVGIDKWDEAIDTCREWFPRDTKIAHVTEPLSRSDDGKTAMEMLLTRPKRVELYDMKRNDVKAKVIPEKPEHQPCTACDEVFHRDDLTMGHITPKSKGGKMHTHNIVRMCAPCNQLQGDDLTLNGLIRLLKKMGRIGESKPSSDESRQLL